AYIVVIFPDRTSKTFYKFAFLNGLVKLLNSIVVCSKPCSISVYILICFGAILNFTYKGCQVILCCSRTLLLNIDDMYAILGLGHYYITGLSKEYGIIEFRYHHTFSKPSKITTVDSTTRILRISASKVSKVSAFFD